MIVEAPVREARRSPRRLRWQAEDLHRLADAGLLPPEVRVELMDGEIVERMSTGPLHMYTVGRLFRLLLGLLEDESRHVRSEQSLRLTEYSEVVPDIAVVSGSLLEDARSIPGAEVAELVVEVSDTTLRYDRGRKLAAYARAGILEYWIVNLTDLQVEVHTEPAGDQYLSRRIHRPGDTLAPRVTPDRTLAVADFLTVSTDE